MQTSSVRLVEVEAFQSSKAYQADLVHLSEFGCLVDKTPPKKTDVWIIGLRQEQFFSIEDGHQMGVPHWSYLSWGLLLLLTAQKHALINPREEWQIIRSPDVMVLDDRLKN